MTATRPALLLMMMVVLAGPASARGISKCLDEASGRVIYTDRSCPVQSDLQRLEIHDNHVGSLPKGLMEKNRSSSRREERSEPNDFSRPATSSNPGASARSASRRSKVQSNY